MSFLGDKGKVTPSGHLWLVLQWVWTADSVLSAGCQDRNQDPRDQVVPDGVGWPMGVSISCSSTVLWGLELAGLPLSQPHLELWTLMKNMEITLNLNPVQVYHTQLQAHWVPGSSGMSSWWPKLPPVFSCCSLADCVILPHSYPTWNLQSLPGTSRSTVSQGCVGGNLFFLAMLL
jgi:hypothetical protein